MKGLKYTSLAVAALTQVSPINNVNTVKKLNKNFFFISTLLYFIY